ncbi:hypothetical protein [Empedobacter falsenii]|uniref:hypothetical protein n=1 Tax=Empedobacter falsenii TaxID=343874 RepID=UPI003A810F6F
MRINYYISKSFILSTGILDLSADQIKRNIKKVAQEEEKKHLENSLHNVNYKDPTVLKLRNENGIQEWHVNYSRINKIGRKRKVKNNTINKVNHNIDRAKRAITRFSYQEPENPRYTTEITLNFKENYEASYYEEVVKELFVRYKKNMYFVVEKDSEGYSHIHIGSEGKKKEIMILMNHIIENVLARFDDMYIKFLEGGNYESDLHISDIVSNDAYKKYLSKGNDGLGGVQIKFLNFN